jgi:adenylate cyclase
VTDTGMRQRLAAILAADAVGYSRLMATDERATVSALDAARGIFRRLIESNQGRVVDMAGDSVLAVFETASGAVSAALTVQKELAQAAEPLPEERRMRFRIGVHLGDVIEKADGTVYGDGINIAARLEALAEPGGITVSETVQMAQRNRSAVAFEDQGEHAVKNIVHLVKAFSVRGADEGAAAASSPRAKPALALPDKPSIAVLPFDNMSGDPEQEFFAEQCGRGDHCDTLAHPLVFRHRAEFGLSLQGQRGGCAAGGPRPGRTLRAGGQRAEGRQPPAHHRAAHRHGQRRACLGGPYRRHAGGRLRPAGSDH